MAVDRHVDDIDEDRSVRAANHDEHSAEPEHLVLGPRIVNPLVKVIVDVLGTASNASSAHFGLRYGSVASVAVALRSDRPLTPDAFAHARIMLRASAWLRR